MNRETKIFAGLSFLISFIVYMMTVSPTVAFWDCGEFTACSYIMGVPHPPGAPLFIMLGRVFTLLLPGIDISLRTNIISVLSTALTIALLFLIIARLIQEWRGKPESFEDRLIINAGAFIGAMSLAFTDTLWFNAVETEVYALSLLLTTLVFWLALVWMDNYKDYKSLKFLLFIVYLWGLGSGVHLLHYMVVPTVFLYILYTDSKFLVKGIIAGVISLPFFIISYFLCQKYGLIGIVPAVILITTLILLKYEFWAAALIIFIIGYSTYFLIIIRAGLQPAINENNPDNWVRFLAYLKREQYGAGSQFLTFFNRNAPIWEYQIKKMFLRYFSWQFIGKGTTLGADGYIAENISFRGLYGIPFLLGLIGVVHHFFKDWKRALSVLVFFIMTSLALVIYQNQGDPQPRERDYFYVGSFLAFAIWIGIGATGILESIVAKFKDNKKLMLTLAGGIILIILLAVPINTLKFNYHEHDRSGNYIPWDYSYNILQSCEPNAILFTNGDNDTFPLWYLQEVEGIRKDIRIANLSLLNTNWYIKQLKHEEPKIAISFSDEEIEAIQPMGWKTQTLKINAPANVLKQYMGNVEGEIELPDTNIVMEFEVSPTLYDKALRVQDYMVLNILYSNGWRKPIYFALTVSDGNKVGLKEYLRMDGMASKLIPFKNEKISESRLRKNLFEVFKYRGLNDPDVYYDKQTNDLLQNYRTLFASGLAQHYYAKGMKDKVPEVLDKMEEAIPSSVIPVKRKEFEIWMGKMYADCGRPEELRKRLDILSEDENLDHQLLYDFGILYYQILKDNKKSIELIKRSIEKKKDNAQAYTILSFLYGQEKMHREEIELLSNWLTVNPNDKGAINKIEILKQLIAKQDSTVN